MAAKALSSSLDHLEQQIFLLRGQKVLLDFDLATLYNVPTKQLKRAVRRNIDRFPPDFMFQLTHQEADSLRRQIGSLKRGENFKYLPHAFTEHGVAMLSSVLNSSRAVQVNIAIVRVFVRLRETLSLHKELSARLTELERKIEGQDQNIQTLFDAIRQLMSPQEPLLPEKEKEMGFHVREEQAPYRAARKSSSRAN